MLTVWGIIWVLVFILLMALALSAAIVDGTITKEKRDE
jgi:hypothetical protein